MEQAPSQAKASRILVFNFFAGIKRRGIPVYARELEACFRRIGVNHCELRAPSWVAYLPAALQNTLFVVFEQVVAPMAALWWRCNWTVYPYNSGSLLDAWTGRSVIVVHDLIPNRSDSRGLAARYIQVCQAWHARLGRPIATVSRHTMRQLGRIRQFRYCEKFLWANPFYAFEETLKRSGLETQRPHKSVTVLLCSGIGPNKDFRGALELLRRLDRANDMVVRVLGFGDDAPLAQRRIEKLAPFWRERVTVLPRLGLEATVAEFLGSHLVWVHSRAEGFGRPVMEARMCGRPVVATDIGAFRQLRRFRHVHLYRDAAFPAVFQAALTEALTEPCSVASAEAFNQKLESEVTRLLESFPARRPVRKPG